MFRLAVFDLDGTLIDSRRDLAESANEMLAGYGARPLPVAAVTAMVGEGARRLIERACAAAGLVPAPEGALERFLAVYDQRLLNHTRCYDGVQPVVASLSTRVTLAVLTNKPGGPTRRLLEHFGLSESMAAVVAGDGPYGRKPDPAGLAAIVAMTGHEPGETLLVGDSWIDLDTAERAGTAFCLARYGFGVGQFPPERLALVELAIDGPADLLSLPGLPPGRPVDRGVGL